MEEWGLSQCDSPLSMLPEDTLVTDECNAIEFLDLLVRESPAESLDVLASLIRVSGSSQRNGALCNCVVQSDYRKMNTNGMS